MNILSWLMDWYKSNCNGDWEHMFGIKIDTVDNPGWMVDIDLLNTTLEGKQFQKIKIDNGDDDWIFCFVEDNKFKAAGDPDKLEKIIEIFKNWAKG